MTDKLAAEIVKKSGIMRDTGMTSATPKPHEGEHTFTDVAVAHAKELDALRERERELVEALERIAAGMGNLPLDQMGEAGVHGINDGKQRAIYLEDYVRTARSVLAKHGR